MASNYGLLGTSDLTKIRNRIIRFAHIDPNTGCWLWTGSLSRQGYGKMTITVAREKTSQRAHRMSFLVFKGVIDESLQICHKCDTPSCVNPDHLFMGTARDNIQDSLQKGRCAITTKTHCLKGHEWTIGNTLYLKRSDNGRAYRRCLECKRSRGRLAYYRNYVGRRKKTLEEKNGR